MAASDPGYTRHSIGELFTGSNFKPRPTGTSRVYIFDLKHDLQPNEFVTSAVWECTAAIGADSNAAAMLSGPPVNTTKTTSQTVGGGIVGVTYRLLATITTNANQRVARWANALVIADPIIPPPASPPPPPPPDSAFSDGFDNGFGIPGAPIPMSAGLSIGFSDGFL